MKFTSGNDIHTHTFCHVLLFVERVILARILYPLSKTELSHGAWTNLIETDCALGNLGILMDSDLTSTLRTHLSLDSESVRTGHEVSDHLIAVQLHDNLIDELCHRCPRPNLP